LASDCFLGLIANQKGVCVITSDQFGGVLRAALAFAAGFLPAAVDLNTRNAVIDGLVAIGVAVWSWYTNKATPTTPAA